MKIDRFEDIEIWQEARILAKMVFRITSVDPFAKDYRFRDQMKAAAGSVMDNIAEGWGRGGNKEFINFLSISKGSCNEVRSQAYRAFDFTYIDETTLSEFLEKTDKISKKTSSFIEYLKKSELKGPKFSKK